MLQWLIRKVFGKVAAWSVRRRLNAFEEATNSPQAVQEALLQGFLRHHADTDFARDHHFKDIKTIADYRKHLPIAGYEYFDPYIQRVTKGDTKALLGDSKVHMFAMTSGTTAARKYIPVTNQYLADYKRGWNIWGLKVYRDHPPVRFRPIIQMSGDWQEFTAPSGIPCGAVTGLTATMQMRIVRWLYCVPAILGKLKDPNAKYYLALRLSMFRKVGMILAANPSTLLNLAKVGDQEKENLLRDLRDGTLDKKIELPADIRAYLAGKLAKKYPDRVKELETAIRQSGTLYPKDIWPKDCVIGNWTGGSMGAYLRQFPKYFGATPVRDLGLIASEGRMTIPMSDNTPSGVLDITTNYLEFVPEDEINSTQPTVLAAHEIQPGRNYYILLTTSYGLYRYNIFDVVRCTGYHNATPMVEFLSKGALFANLTGEKISEYHVTGAMTQTLRDLDMNVTAYTLAPIWHDEMPYYGLFIERGDLANRERGAKLGEVFERRLQEANVEYAGKRETQRLGPVRVEVIPTGAWQIWDRQRLTRSGGTLEQYKHPCLLSDLKFRESLTVEEEIG